MKLKPIIKDVNKDSRLKDKDRDLPLVVKEALRTRTRARTNIPANYI